MSPGTTFPALGGAFLALRNITKRFGDVCVLDGVDMRLESGRIHTLRGGNGSGKTGNPAFWMEGGHLLEEGAL